MKADDIALIPEGDGARFVRPMDGFCEAYKKWAEGKMRKHAKDGLLSSPLLGLAALLYLLGKFHEPERVGPQDYNLMTYRPKKREW
jgi:hypothetical protein